MTDTTKKAEPKARDAKKKFTGPKPMRHFGPTVFPIIKLGKLAFFNLVTRRKTAHYPTIGLIKDQMGPKDFEALLRTPLPVFADLSNL